MSKKIKKVQGVNFYSVDYLINHELNENELYDLFETPSLHYSLFLGMFAFIGDKRTPDELITMGKKDSDWMYKNFWSEQQKQQYIELVTKILMNIYQFGKETSRHNAEHWVCFNGLSLENLRKQYSKIHGKSYN